MLKLPVPTPVPATKLPARPGGEPSQVATNLRPLPTAAVAATTKKIVSLDELTEGDVLARYPRWFRHQRIQLAHFFTASRKFPSFTFPLPLPTGYPYNLGVGGIKLNGAMPVTPSYTKDQLVEIMEGYITRTKETELSYRKELANGGQLSVRTLQRWRKATREKEKAQEHGQPGGSIYGQRSKKRYQDQADTFPLKITLSMLASGETSNKKLAQLIARSDWSARIYKNTLLDAVLLHALRGGLYEVLVSDNNNSPVCKSV